MESYLPRAASRDANPRRARSVLMTALCVVLSLAPGLVILPDDATAQRGLLWRLAAPEESVQECTSSWAHELALARGGGWTIRELEPGQRERFMAGYNAHVPKTDFRADHVYVGTHPDAPHFVVAAMVEGDDCVVQIDEIPIPEMQKLLGGNDL